MRGIAMAIMMLAIIHEENCIRRTEGDTEQRQYVGRFAAFWFIMTAVVILVGW